MALYFLENAADINGDISEIRHSSLSLKLQVYTNKKKNRITFNNQGSLSNQATGFVFLTTEREVGVKEANKGMGNLDRLCNRSP